MNNYDNIDFIKLELKFSDPDGMVKPSYKTKEYHPSKHLILKIDCPRISCINGGFDITSEVKEALLNNENVVNLTSSCQGWQDSRRINKNRCLCHMSCNVTLGYTNT
ncbi:hypothetical protein [Aliivibrio fischeri]|uniref:hypothetical protein n=1 Tax=Aliivibrio fischeri TaxID=668 RepID=UPI0012D95FE3|nr:hypothetical protein [Aliivibrio fischeri]MUI54398.1 hypothetical protein [Aliivibrio fischeri]